MSTTGRRKGRTWEEQFVRPLGDSDSALLMLPLRKLRAIVRKRHEQGADRHDEVWDGVYFIAPAGDWDHSGRVISFGTALTILLEASLPHAQVVSGPNVSDQRDDWRSNFRNPDVAVLLPGNPAEIRGSHLFGGPDFAIEIISPRDRSRQKFDFYHRVGVRELLFVDRHPWQLELYRRGETEFRVIGTSTLNKAETLSSAVLPLSFRLIPGSDPPRIEVACTATGQIRLA